MTAIATVRRLAHWVILHPWPAPGDPPPPVGPRLAQALMSTRRHRADCWVWLLLVWLPLLLAEVGVAQVAQQPRGYMLGRLRMVGRPIRPAVAVLQGTGGGGGTPAYKEAPAGEAAGAGKE